MYALIACVIMILIFLGLAIGFTVAVSKKDVDMNDEQKEYYRMYITATAFWGLFLCFCCTLSVAKTPIGRFL